MVQSRILVSISPRNGFVLVQDTADMASPGRVGRFTQAGEAVSRQPQALAEQVALLKFAVRQTSFLSYFWGLIYIMRPRSLRTLSSNKFDSLAIHVHGTEDSLLGTKFSSKSSGMGLGTFCSRPWLGSRRMTS
jgi:hypothetical protein